MLKNLATYFAALQCGNKPLQIKYGFIHPEPLGVVALDQSKGGKNLAQTRLYLYPDTDDEILHLITLGDKDSQKDDIKASREYVTQLRERKTLKHEPQDHQQGGEQEAIH